ncbi:MAG: ImmA/IrrE family metallo-endopeptidase [bacterium]|nr:ImmA/IrrE family metallo-endopeptidase [bacterium]
MARDYEVRIKSREDIAKIAMSWWLAATRSRYHFNICTFVTKVLACRLRDKGKLTVKFYPSAEIPDRAFVTFNPATLHIDEQIWKDADIGKAYARFIIAHEIGHLVLHDEFAVAFSDEKAAQLVYVQNEESGEWQANTFADLFLVPDFVARKLKLVDLVAGLCVVTDELAARQILAAQSAKAIVSPYSSDICGTCWNLTVLSNGATLTCDTCDQYADV